MSDDSSDKTTADASTSTKANPDAAPGTLPGDAMPTDAAAESAEATQGAAAGDTQQAPFLTRVVVTGSTGFVGRYVVRELIARGHMAVCLVRDREKFQRRQRDLSSERYEFVGGDLDNKEALARACEGAEAVVHLVGIIQQNRLAGQTFERVHVEGTRNIVDAARAAGTRRFVHMSALGTRLHAKSKYHRTKWEAEAYVRESGLDWTVFRPSIIHGPDGEFMEMMKLFVCDAWTYACGIVPMPFPVIPYFGDGENKLQPVSVRDVAHCFAAALSKPETIGRIYDLGGPEALSWKDLYRVCRETIPCAKPWKPLVGQPVLAAKAMAILLKLFPILPKKLRFDVGQVQMSQEDSVCDTQPVEEAFGIKMRDFRRELAAYAEQIA